MTLSERIKRVLQIRRSNASGFVKNKKKYSRKTKHKKANYDV